jgi:cell division protein FtsN
MGQAGTADERHDGTKQNKKRFTLRERRLLFERERKKKNETEQKQENDWVGRQNQHRKSTEETYPSEDDKPRRHREDPEKSLIANKLHQIRYIHPKPQGKLKKRLVGICEEKGHHSREKDGDQRSWDGMP